VPAGPESLRLFQALDPDPERAGEEYLKLHTRLTRYFASRGSAIPDELADRTLDRVARRLETEVIQSFPKYSMGVARRVYAEDRRGGAAT